MKSRSEAKLTEGFSFNFFLRKRRKIVFQNFKQFDIIFFKVLMNWGERELLGRVGKGIFFL